MGYLRRETNATLSTLRSRSNFFWNDSSKQKRFYLSARELHDKCSASVSVEIISFEHLQQGSYEKLNLEIFLQDYLQPNASQVPTMMSLWKMITVFRSLIWNFLSPYYVTCFAHPNIYGERDFVSWKNIRFCGLKKQTFISDGRKIQVNSSKDYVKFFCSANYFPSYISPLIWFSFAFLISISIKQ